MYLSIHSFKFLKTFKIYFLSRILIKGCCWLFVYEPWSIGERSDRRNFHQMSHQTKEFNQRQQINSCGEKYRASCESVVILFLYSTYLTSSILVLLEVLLATESDQNLL